MSGLIDDLLADPHGFDLFQAIRLLERAAPALARIGTSVGRNEAVQLKADPSLAFASSDISSLERVGEPDGITPPFRLSSAALSLAGAHGPLPVVFTELLLDAQRRRDVAGLAFLDIFNQRILAFLYRSRVKHRLALQDVVLSRSDAVKVIQALSGVQLVDGAVVCGPGRDEGDQVVVGHGIRHAALRGAAPRSMATLQALVQDDLGLAVKGRPLQGAWFELPLHERAVLGRVRSAQHAALRLGCNGSLGRRAWDQAAGIECRLDDLSLWALHALLPGQPVHRRLAWLIESHLQSRIRVVVVAGVAIDGQRTCPLGRVTKRRTDDGSAVLPSHAERPPSMLGHTTWLGGRGLAARAGSRLLAPTMRPPQDPRFSLRRSES